MSSALPTRGFVSDMVDGLFCLIYWWSLRSHQERRREYDQMDKVSPRLQLAIF
jgi:hypothetical protein